MRFATLRHDGRLGIALDDDGVLRALFAGDPSYPGSIAELIGAGSGFGAAAAALRGAAVLDPDTVEFLPPLPAPPKVLCVGLNYVDHAKEVDLPMPEFPTVFGRFASSLTGHGAELVRPRSSRQYDYEAELAVVIGKAGRSIPKARALEHVAGYAAFNDTTLRDLQFRTSQWCLGKNIDRSGAFGPWFMTADALPPGCRGLRIAARLNGETVQDSNIDRMIFDVETLIADISGALTLEPGDVIVTGTPAGVGVSRKPQLFLKPGDVVEVEIERIGVLRNTVVDGSADGGRA